MGGFLLRKVGAALIVLLLASMLVFVGVRAIPGDPAIALGAENRDPAVLAAIRHKYLLDKPLPVQYAHWIWSSLQGDFGISLTFFPDTVTHQVLQALPWTLALVGVTTIIAFILGTVIGLVSGWRRGGVLDGALPPLFVITSAFPYFWLALVTIWLFSIKLGWFPESGGYEVTTTVGWNWTFFTDAVNHSILPALTIIVTAIGGWILTMRNNMITVLTEDYVRMARAKGLKPWRIMWTYAGRNAILPNLVGFAMSLGFVVGGAILVEFVFNYPGVGWMFLQSVENQDYALMQALFLMITVTVLLAVLVADGATAVLDPRTRDRR